MADICQTPEITTLPRLKKGFVHLEKEIRQYVEQKPVALVLPALYSEFTRPAMKRICDTLVRADYLERIIVSIQQASKEELAYAKTFFKDFTTRVDIVWHENPEMAELLADVEKAGIPLGPPGKGRACWLAYGAALANGAKVIAVHDCDITTYSRELLVRLIYPLLNPTFNCRFCKGYYARFSHKIHARVSRLFVAPLLAAFSATKLKEPLIDYLKEFRYPLSGEFAMDVAFLENQKLPGNWGLEIGLLSDVHDHCSTNEICQAEITGRYNHKHQQVAASKKTRGLEGMVLDIMLCLLEILSEKGHQLNAKQCRQWLCRYQELAPKYAEKYQFTAKFNGLEYSEHDEQKAIATFTGAMEKAISKFLDQKNSTIAKSMLPSWGSVTKAIPDFLERYQAIVDSDSRKTN